VRPVLFADCQEFQSQANARRSPPHHAVGPDLPFWNKKMKFGWNPHRCGSVSLNEKPAQTNIPNARKVFASIAPPIDPHVRRRLDTRGQSPGRGVSLGQIGSPGGRAWGSSPHNSGCATAINIVSKAGFSFQNFKNLKTALRGMHGLPERRYCTRFLPLAMPSNLWQAIWYG
jgi:hypothetical protein